MDKLFCALSITSLNTSVHDLSKRNQELLAVAQIQ